MFQKELERGPDKFFRGDLTAFEVGGKSGRYAHVVAGASGCLDISMSTGVCRECRRVRGDLVGAARDADLWDFCGAS